MPAISAIVVPRPAYVYLEANLADVSGAVYGCVDRVDCLTGERFQLRPYVSYSTSGCLSLSCGQGIWWDTEAPLDRCLYYCVTAMDADGNIITQPADPLILATFSTVAVASWPPADTGQIFTNTGGAAADYSGTGTRGQHAVTSTGVLRVSSTAMTTANATATVTAFPAAVALTQATEQHLWLRADAAGANGYRARLRFNTAATVDLILESVVAGVATSLGLVSAFSAYAATSGFGVRLQTWGNQISASAWDITGPEPATAMITATSTVHTAAGSVAMSSLRNAGNTNGTVNFQWDNLTVTDVCADAVPAQACTPEVVVPSGGCFRLGDPVRPCHDQIVCLEGGDGCVPGEGIYFGNMSPEQYPDNSGQLLPVNARRPITVSRNRRDVQSALTLVTATFGDRDDVLTLNEPGSPLLWRGPAEYGIPDRYMSVLDVDVERSFSDHREEPRVIGMPHWAVDAPVGPATGVCGTRVTDLCDVYATWDALIAAGLTYADLLRGAAGAPGDVRVDPVTWSEVNAAYANWTALNAGEDDWNDVWRDIG
jgi:hypothetical protein